MSFVLQQRITASKDRLSLFGLIVKPVQRFPTVHIAFTGKFLFLKSQHAKEIWKIMEGAHCPIPILILFRILMWTPSECTEILSVSNSLSESESGSVNAPLLTLTIVTIS